MFHFNNIILASGSPRRKQLLKQIGIDFTTEISGVDESIEFDLSPERIAKYFAIEKARKTEILTDQMQVEISNYLAECTKHELSVQSAQNASDMIRIVNELESVGDSTLNLFLQIDRLKDDLKLSDEIKVEVSEMYDVVMKFIEWNNSFILNDIQSISQEDLDKSIKYENEIDEIRNNLLDSSQSRLSKGSNPKAELLFIDIIKHLEHIGDYSLNISQALEQTN